MLPVSMTRSGLTTLMIACSFLVSSPASGHGPYPAGPRSDVCLCAGIASGTGWCSACNVGFVGSVRVPSASLFEMIDPHGHDLDPAGISCSTCMNALETSAFCERCGIGYVDGRAYVSRLAYLIARGEPEDSSALETEFNRLNVAIERLSDCDLCGVASFADGRCPRCRIHYQDGVPVVDPQNEKD
jgi:hypothetical protein